MGGGGSKSGSSVVAQPKGITDATLKEAQENGSLDLSGLRLSDGLPQSACVTGVGNIREILVSFNLYKSIPQNLSVFKNLESLRLDGCLIVEFSIQPLLSLPNLVELGLNGNQISSLPADFGSLSQIEKLELANNQLTALPPSLGQLVRLEELTIMGNPIRRLPESIGTMQNLESLDASCCELAFLPDEFTRCTRLMELNLSMNALQELPPTIGNLTRLVTLHLSDNKLCDLPLSLGFCQYLETISFSRNPIKDPKLLEEQKQSAARICHVLESRMQNYFMAQGIVGY